MLGQFNNLIKFSGFQLTHIAPKPEDQFIITRELEVRQKILNTFSINRILDIGANIGQFATTMRKLGFEGMIVSFEPLSSAFQKINENAKNDPLWQCQNYALGNEESFAEINIAGNSYSSSMLEMLPEHINYDPESEYIDKETIQIKTLDSIFNTVTGENDRIWCKIDTQGFEKKVLEGATSSINQIDILQLEISLAPLYQNEPLFSELYPFILNMGFELFTIEYGIRDHQSGRMLQMDCIFKNCKNK